MSSVSLFDQVIQDGSILNHYFYKQLWNEGKLTEDNMKTYICEYLTFAKAVPSIVEKVKTRAQEAGYSRVAELEQNRIEEEEHVELWKRFGHSYGLTDEVMESYIPSKEVTEAVAELEELASGSFDDGVACMYALELDLPNVAQTKKEGLCNHYNKPESNADAHIYFDEHLGEEAHLQVWRRIDIDTEATAPVVAKALAAQHKVLDGVCETAGLCMC